MIEEFRKEFQSVNNVRKRDVGQVSVFEWSEKVVSVRLEHREERRKSVLKTDWYNQLLKTWVKIVWGGRMNVNIGEMIHTVGSSQFEMKVKEIIVGYRQVP